MQIAFTMGLAALAALSAGVGLAVAEEDWPARPQAARSGAFAVMQIATDDPEGLMAAWARPTPGARLNIIRTVRIGRPISAFISFRACQPDADGLCRVTTEWSLLEPGGRYKVVARTKVRAGLPPPGPGAIGLSTEAPEFDFSDRPGLYRIRARTTDHVAGITLQTEDAITVTN